MTSGNGGRQFARLRPVEGPRGREISAGFRNTGASGSISDYRGSPCVRRPPRARSVAGTRWELDGDVLVLVEEWVLRAQELKRPDSCREHVRSPDGSLLA